MDGFDVRTVAEKGPFRIEHELVADDRGRRRRVLLLARRGEFAPERKVFQQRQVSFAAEFGDEGVDCRHAEKGPSDDQGVQGWEARGLEEVDVRVCESCASVSENFEVREHDPTGRILERGALEDHLGRAGVELERSERCC